MTRRTNQPQMPQLNFYGGLQPQQVIGLDDYQQVDGATIWDDEGKGAVMIQEAIAKIVASLAPAVSQYGAEQARDAVAEYARTSYFDVCAIAGEVYLAVDYSSNDQPLRALVPLRQLLEKSAAEAHQAGDMVTVGAIQSLMAPPAAQLQQAQRRAAPAPRPALRTPVIGPTTSLR